MSVASLIDTQGSWSDGALTELWCSPTTACPVFVQTGTSGERPDAVLGLLQITERVL